MSTGAPVGRKQIPYKKKKNHKFKINCFVRWNDNEAIEVGPESVPSAIFEFRQSCVC